MAFVLNILSSAVNNGISVLSFLYAKNLFYKLKVKPADAKKENKITQHAIV